VRVSVFCRALPTSHVIAPKPDRSKRNEVSADLDLVGQRAMDGTLLCNLHQSRALRFVQCPDQFDTAPNAIDLRFWIFAIDAIIGIGRQGRDSVILP
jgi:hypothetical protein